MKLVAGPRPWAIRLFAALCILTAVVGLLESMVGFGFLHGDGSWQVPADEGERIEAVTLTCARLSVALVPLAFVWLSASNVARWLILAFSGIKIWAVLLTGRDSLETPAAYLDPYAVASPLLGVAVAAVLFTPSANRWFEAAKRPVERVFD